MTSNRELREQSLKKLDKELKARRRAEKLRPLGVVVAALAIIVVLVGGIWFAATRDGQSEEEIQASEEETSTPETPEAQPLPTARTTPLPANVTCEYPDEMGPDGKPMKASRDVTKPETENISARGKVTVVFKTNQGDIPVEMDRDLAPCAVNSVQSLIEQKFYDDTKCHRLTTDGIYVLQCGDPDGTGAGGPGYTMKEEFPGDEMGDTPSVAPSLYERGTLAMAKKATPGSTGSQMFFTYKDSPLAPEYTVAGRISDDGLKVLDKIAEKGIAEPEGQPAAGDGEPKDEVRIEQVVIES
ncbi:peptidylprolyl isomerase [Corynebacterium ulceribovis]|uniref:peptidylprolyl isomerase n=1 Tax=Corynebacterium ulceribovis TaxID=487732 RepID=UPI00036753D8|nr:peptidylprolyl isomerase [Corynebacterium ulceribovis]